MALLHPGQQPPIHAPSPSALLAEILDDPRVAERITEMSGVALHRLVSSIGRGDAIELMALATPDQMRELVDLEVWQGDRVDLQEALDWLHLITTQLPEDVSARDLRALDVELVSYVLLRHIRVYLAEEAPEEFDGTPISTPDGWYVLELLPDDSASIGQLTEVVDRLYRIDNEDTRRLLQCLMWELPTELEEMAHRWRNGRLQDLGFADPTDALLIYAYLAPGSVRAGEQTADRPLVSDPEPVGTDLMALQPPETDSFWSRALARIDEPAQRLRLTQTLMALGNRSLSADRVAPADMEGGRESLEQLRWRLSLGLEHLCTGNPDLAPEVLTSVALLRVARVGHSLALDRRRRLGRLARETGLGRGPGRLDLVDQPLRQRLAPMLASRPAFFDEVTASCRPFHDLEDLGQADRWIEQAAQLAAVARDMSLPSPLPDGVTFGDLFRTALVNHLLGRDPTQPVDRDTLAGFLGRYVVNGRLTDEVRVTALESVPDRPEHRGLASQWTADLEQAVGPLDPAALDLRFVDGLWLKP